ncbi:MAG: NAD(P)-dependent oxidoreductase [Deltaproteobacteria bacterium]|nr:NAD(P)-dependent oxidoreductase [Deltaproteobacteria bacterium]
MILVTGAPGWLGNRLLEALTGKIAELNDLVKDVQSTEIRCLCLPGSDTAWIKSLSNNIKIYSGDVTEKNTLNDFFKGSEGAIIFHLVGVIHPTRGIKQLYEVNVEGTKNILDMALQNKAGKVLIMSSNSQSGTNPNKEHRFTEESPYNPYMNYGRSKMKMEILAKQYISEKNMDITIIRGCWFYGPHQPDRQTEFFTMIKNGGFPLLGKGDSVRSMSYVDNLCQGLIKAAQHTISKGKIYWIADERAYQMNEIISTVSDILKNDFGMQVKEKQMNLPAFIGDIAQIADWFLQTIRVYNQKIHVLSEMNKTIACSVELAKKEIGYKPHIELREGMRRSIEWCLKKGQKI